MTKPDYSGAETSCITTSHRIYGGHDAAVSAAPKLSSRRLSQRSKSSMTYPSGNQSVQSGKTDLVDYSRPNFTVGPWPNAVSSCYPPCFPEENLIPVLEDPYKHVAMPLIRKSGAYTPGRAKIGFTKALGPPRVQLINRARKLPGTRVICESLIDQEFKPATPQGGEPLPTPQPLQDRTLIPL